MLNYKLNSIYFLVLFILLTSCEGETTTSNSNLTSSEDTIQKLDNIGYLETKVVTIDSNNHEEFIDKNGFYEASWNMLQDAKIELNYFPKFQSQGYLATFGTSPLFLANKKISIDGYVIPILVDSTSKSFKYILSYYPNSSCFFCGGGGPETVLELFLKEGHRNFREDEYLRFSGVLKLNSDNPWELNYALLDAEPLE